MIEKTIRKYIFEKEESLKDIQNQIKTINLNIEQLRNQIDIDTDKLKTAKTPEEKANINDSINNKRQSINDQQLKLKDLKNKLLHHGEGEE